MLMHRLLGQITIFVVLVLLLAPSARAQQATGGLTGAASDTTGAVLPGVTVEATSEALIEGSRVAITDGQGRFNIVRLPPGNYTVTFTLPGFSTFIREGVELSAGFTATVNADMAVGGVEETITVTGASPVVDVQNTSNQAELDYDILEALPTGGRDLTQYVSVTLGAVGSTAGRNDVGGNLAESNTGVSIHGSRGDDGRINYNGMNTNNFYGGGGGQQRVWKFNTIAVQETVINAGTAGAETETGGANVNMIPRDGANFFSAHTIWTYTDENFVDTSVRQEITDRAAFFAGLTGVNPEEFRSVRKIWDYGGGVGGPIARDKVWFYAAGRAWGGQTFAPNNFEDKSTNPLIYEPDFDRPAFGDFWQWDTGIRITWQAAEQHKINSSLNQQRGCGCQLALALGAQTAPEATTDFQYGLGDGMQLWQTDWTYTPSSRLLIEAGTSFLFQDVAFTNFRFPGENNIAITDTARGYTWGALPGSIQGGSYDDRHGSNNFTQRASVSYVTGSHNAKFGMQTLQGVYDIVGNALPGGVNYRFQGGSTGTLGVPFELTQFASPFANNVRIRNLGLYAQDQWTLDRLTINAGVRVDWVHSYAKAITLPAGPFVGERSYPEVRDLPNYKDVVPRLGVAYDLSGNGRTAIKASWGKYLIGIGGGDARDRSPAVTVVDSTRRLWNDANGNFAPDCDLTSAAANGECGPWQTPGLGSSATAGAWADEARMGWGVREFSYQTSVSFQHELVPGFGINVAYHRNDFKNQQALINNALQPGDYSPYCIQAPTDSRLGFASGSQVCGFYDENPSVFGLRDIERVRVEDIEGRNGDPSEVFNGLDIAMNARFDNGATLLGGVSFGVTAVDYCWLNDLPNVDQLRMPANMARTPGYCDISPPIWDGQGSQIKIQAVYPLPYDMAVSGSYKNLPGVPLQANLVTRNFEIAPSLGRDLSACVQAGLSGFACPVQVTSAVLPIGGGDSGTLAGELYDERVNQVDLRFSKGFNAGGARIQAIAELYNAFNTRVSQFNLNTYDALLGGFLGNPGFLYNTPFSVLGGRTFKFGAQVDF